MKHDTSDSRIVEIQIFNPRQKEEYAQFLLLKSHPKVQVIDKISSQALELIKIRNPTYPISTNREFILKKLEEYLSLYPDTDLIGSWVYYPWSNKLIHVLSRDEFIEVRTNRNKLKITETEQLILSQKSVGIAGLSVGKSIAMTMALERSVNEFRLADFDTIELSNLNRLNTSLSDIGLNKAIAVARAILELDPYFKVKVFTEGLNEGNFESFFLEETKIDLFIEECDALDIKVLSRLYAKHHKIPVFMEASDRCLIDVERFDEENDRPILHGLIQDLDVEKLKTLKTDEDKLPYLVKIVGLETLSPRMKSSMLEIQQTLTSWPQLGSDVVMGAGIGAEIVRKILLKQLSGSGRFRIDPTQNIPLRKLQPYGLYSAYLKNSKTSIRETISAQVMTEILQKQKPDHKVHRLELDDQNDLKEAAHLAPSGGNLQPWIWLFQPEGVHLFLDTSKTDTYLDLNRKASYIALGCSIHNFESKAAELSYNIESKYYETSEPLIASFYLNKMTAERSLNTTSKYLYTRETNRTRKKTSRKASYDHLIEELKAILQDQPDFFIEHYQPEELPPTIRTKIIQSELDRMNNIQGYNDFYAEINWTDSLNDLSRRGIEINTAFLNPKEETGVKLGNKANSMEESIENYNSDKYLTLVTKIINHNHLIILLSKQKIILPSDSITTGKIINNIWNTLTSHYVNIQPLSFQRLHEEHKSNILFIFSINEINKSQLPKSRKKY